MVELALAKSSTSPPVARRASMRRSKSGISGAGSFGVTKQLSGKRSQRAPSALRPVHSEFAEYRKPTVARNLRVRGIDVAKVSGCEHDGFLVESLGRGNSRALGRENTTSANPAETKWASSVR